MGCFLLLLLKTRTCTEYTVTVVSFKISIYYYLLVLILNGTWTDARLPVPDMFRYGYVPLRFGGNVVRRMGTHQQLEGNDYMKKSCLRYNNNVTGI